MNHDSIKLLICASLLGLAAPAVAVAVNGDVKVRVSTGDVTSVAVGDNATSRINLGGLPPSNGKGCAKTNVNIGNILKFAVGRNAKATIDIPDHTTHCEE